MIVCNAALPHLVAVSAITPFSTNTIVVLDLFVPRSSFLSTAFKHPAQTATITLNVRLKTHRALFHFFQNDIFLYSTGRISDFSVSANS